MNETARDYTVTQRGFETWISERAAQIDQFTKRSLTFLTAFGSFFAFDCCIVAPNLPCRLFTPGFPVTYGGR